MNVIDMTSSLASTNYVLTRERGGIQGLISINMGRPLITIVLQGCLGG
jgi:hypothetical protein